MQTIFLFITVGVLMANFLADMLYGVLDPRVRRRRVIAMATTAPGPKRLTCRRDTAAAIDDAGALAESRRAGVAKRRRSLGCPDWFGILWHNRKSRVGLILLRLLRVRRRLRAVAGALRPARQRLRRRSRRRAATTGWAPPRPARTSSRSSIYGARTSLIVGILGGALATMIGAGHRHDRRLLQGHGRRVALLLHQPRAGRADPAR